MTTVLENISLFTDSGESLPSFVSTGGYQGAEQKFIELLNIDNLDREIESNRGITHGFDAYIDKALREAYEENSNFANLFLQRVLYRINRLNLFWYDDLSNYKNERSFYLQSVRNKIENRWQAWELKNFDLAALQNSDVKEELLKRGAADLHPPVTPSKAYLTDTMSVEGYRYLLAVASLDGLVEASRMSRILGGASNEVQATLIRVLLEEYGNGRLHKKHSTFFAQMMAELGLNTEPEYYFHLAPWELLASINHNFLLTECKQHFLRYNGGLTYFEIVGPSIYEDYKAAARRLNLSETAMGYWTLHIKEDERHGQWMLEDVALALTHKYPHAAWEILLGYDQEKWMGDRAGNAVIRLIKQFET
ncbi:MAG: hypothetical protein N5P05_000725 [Chroococcopsis gigantea SAG 12.99]|jgi:hypothetical protein|nr:iron-containing redox enzyme family protein [Chlorogloea purpurea SAG 13.99]MDV2999119.1 hypothetical protein [Chroococcopsis gigantea SAG 12.99]